MTERYDRNCVCVHYKFHRIDVRHGLFGVSLTHPAHSNSSLISELLNCLVIAIQHKLFVGTVSFLLSNDGIKLLISNIVPMSRGRYLGHFLLGMFCWPLRTPIPL